MSIGVLEKDGVIRHHSGEGMVGRKPIKAPFRCLFPLALMPASAQEDGARARCCCSRRNPRYEFFIAFSAG